MHSSRLPLKVAVTANAPTGSDVVPCTSRVPETTVWVRQPVIVASVASGNATVPAGWQPRWRVRTGAIVGRVGHRVVPSGGGVASS